MENIKKAIQNEILILTKRMTNLIKQVFESESKLNDEQLHDIKLEYKELYFEIANLKDVLSHIKSNF